MEVCMFKEGDTVRYVNPNMTKDFRVGDISVINKVKLDGDNEWFVRVDGSKQFFYQWRFEKLKKVFKGNLK